MNRQRAATVQRELYRLCHRGFEPFAFSRQARELAALARQDVPVGILSRATNGHPKRSPRYRNILQPVGLEAELRAAYRAESSIWGASALYQERGGPDFQPDEAAFVADVSCLLGEGFRRSLTASGMQTGAVVGDGPGLVI